MNSNIFLRLLVRGGPRPLHTGVRFMTPTVHYMKPVSPLVTMFGTKRFNSTSVSAATAVPAVDSAGASSEIVTSLPSLAEIPSKVVSTVSPDQIGYLESLDIVLGYTYPSDIAGRLLEALHISAGLPWWASIMVACIVVRLALVPMYVKMTRNMAKLSHIRPELDVISEKMSSGDQRAMQLATMERKKLFKENDIKMRYSLTPLINLPVTIGFYRVILRMAEYPVSGFTSEGILWFQNLAAVDSVLGLQIITACLIAALVKFGGEAGASTMSPPIKKVMMAAPFASIFITYNFSAGVVWYFAVSAFFSAFQSALFRSPAFRKWANLPAITNRPPLPGSKPQPTTIMEWLKKQQENSHKKSLASSEYLSKKLDNIEKRKQDSHNFIKKH
ncbi:Mitochondrial inner membrane protein oxa1 [Scheffersomyces spartinae]|uniref:Mitochondrial inner membrane protein oxa1 n=1 Tax=Scheffersomyces spartinae TaxID=45513 RepID=A0A9P8AHE7_9ASCO|nr:Mitochondrial inner membrane protein oxa1 [Scheffersomyces spartinae]KAG7192432.1 Mitochondrial inner membrane protein oxa1 [Scheffersomyces spartinae]